MKMYGISAHSDHPDGSLIDTAKQLAQSRLPADAQSGKNCGVGYLIVHEGATADYVFVDWWFDNDIVQHHPYGAPKGQGGNLQYRWPEGAGFCVWELAVHWHERGAWIKHVLGEHQGPDFDAYLADQMNGDV